MDNLVQECVEAKMLFRYTCKITKIGLKRLWILCFIKKHIWDSVIETVLAWLGGREGGSRVVCSASKLSKLIPNSDKNNYCCCSEFLYLCIKCHSPKHEDMPFIEYSLYSETISKFYEFVLIQFLWNNNTLNDVRTFNCPS